jgi:hypothetical protein
VPLSFSLGDLRGPFYAKAIKYPPGGGRVELIVGPEKNADIVWIGEVQGVDRFPFIPDTNFTLFPCSTETDLSRDLSLPLPSKRSILFSINNAPI